MGDGVAVGAGVAVCAGVAAGVAIGVGVAVGVEAGRTLADGAAEPAVGAAGPAQAATRLAAANKHCQPTLDDPSATRPTIHESILR